jgi:lipopolysaccharide/colanic/teichoic acid biosynthesis glycosyltransferase
MVQNAEKNGPALSSRNDKRVTKLGKFLRKTRLDETPQFINVLKGDMSIVGPRPERKFYIDKILKKAPEYNLLLNVKPGITSLGQVKFGYASDVNQMLKRLRFDLVYIKHKTLLLDFKILYLTILVLLKGNGV